MKSHLFKNRLMEPFNWDGSLFHWAPQLSILRRSQLRSAFCVRDQLRSSQWNAALWPSTNDERMEFKCNLPSSFNAVSASSHPTNHDWLNRRQWSLRALPQPSNPLCTASHSTVEGPILPLQTMYKCIVVNTAFAAIEDAFFSSYERCIVYTK